jgi:hypothetical protein
MRSTGTGKEHRSQAILSKQDNDNDADNFIEDYELLFDARPKDDDSLKEGQAVREKNFSLLNFLRSKRDNIFQWFQSARNYVENLFSGSPNSNPLIHVRRDPDIISGNNNTQSLIYARNSIGIAVPPPENNSSHAEYEIGLIPEKISGEEKYLNDFNQFKSKYQRYKNNEIKSIDNFKTESAKSYATLLFQEADKKFKNDPNYFFKNIPEYKDVAIASIILGGTNKFEPRSPTKDQEKNFKLWVISKDPREFSKLTSEGFKVDLEKAKIYADWIVFKSAIGETPNGVDDSVIAHATDLKGMMDGAKIESLNQSVDKIGQDMLEFFPEKNTEKDKSIPVIGDEVKEVDKFPSFPRLYKETIDLIREHIAPEMSLKEFNALLIKSGLFFDGLNNPIREVDLLLDGGVYALTFANLWSKARNDLKKLEIFRSQEFFSRLDSLLDIKRIDAILSDLTHGNSRSSVQDPAAVIASVGLPNAPINSEISSSPPPPPPRRLKATSEPAATNANGSTDIAQPAPPPAPPSRVRKIAEENQQKPNDVVVTLRPVAEPDVERNNLSLSQCVDIFKNLGRRDQTVLGQILAPNMESSDFRSLVNQSSLFFTDRINDRPIDAARQAHAYELSILWGSAKTNPLASDGLRQLKFFSELDYLMDSSKR